MKSIWKWAFETTPVWNWLYWFLVVTAIFDLLIEFINWVS